MTFFDETPKEKSSLRWLILILCCSSTFGDYYCFDNVGAVHNHLQSQFDFLGEKFEYYYNLLYSLYSFVNIFAPFLGGALIQISGNKPMFIVFGFFIVIGQLIVFLGCQNYSMKTMIIGRIIFGLGGENLNVSQMSFVVNWFYKSEMALPMGLTLTISRCGSFLNDVISPILAGETDQQGKLAATNAFFWGLIFSIFSFIVIILLVFLDHLKEIAIINNRIRLHNQSNNNIQDQEQLAAINIKSNNIFYLMKQLKLLFWILSLLILFSYGFVMPFNYIAVGFYTSSPYNISKRQAGIYMGVPFIMGALLVPLLGVAIDKYGYRCELTISSGIFCLISFILFSIIKPYIPLVLLGIGYSIFASVLWPAISIAVVNKDLVGFAFGVATCLQNISMFINPLVIAWILVKFNNYFYCLLFLDSLTVFSIALSCWLYNENKYNNNKILDRVEYDDEMKPNNNKYNINLEMSSNKNDTQQNFGEI